MTDQSNLPRQATENDIPPLKALWQTVFGDSSADIDHFFTTWFSPDLTAVIDDGTKPVSAAYVLPVGDLVLPANERLACAMIYAIATHPEFRGRGFGAIVTRAAHQLAVQKGYPAVILKPANDGLFAFYEKHSDFREFFEASESEFTAEELAPKPGYAFTPVTPAEYRALRQSCLKGAAYIDMDERGLSYQLYLSAKAGGGLYKLLFNGNPAGCAAIEPEVGAVSMKELLLKGNCRIMDAVSAAAALLVAEKYKVRTLAAPGNSQTRFGMIASVEGRPNVPYVHSAKWYGLAFD